jgi:hypothetical protein
MSKQYNAREKRKRAKRRLKRKNKAAKENARKPGIGRR